MKQNAPSKYFLFLITVMMSMMDGSVSVNPQTGVETVVVAYFVGAILGGAISGLSFDLCGLTTGNLVMCMIAKIFLMLVFVPIFVLISIAAKQKAWLALCGSLGGGMLLFMMVPMITPLGSAIMNVGLCLIGGLLFAIGLGAISNRVLKKTSLV